MPSLNTFAHKFINCYFQSRTMAYQTRATSKRQRDENPSTSSDTLDRQNQSNDRHIQSNDSAASETSNNESPIVPPRKVPPREKHKNARNGVVKIPSYDELSQQNPGMFTQRDGALQFLIDNLIIPNFSSDGEKDQRRCQEANCTGLLSWKDKNRKTVRCSSTKCPRKSQENTSSTFSPFKGTFFSGARDIPKVLKLGYCWLNQFDQNQTRSFTKASTATIAAYYEYFRQLVSSMLEESDLEIGGKDVIVQIDESKFAKRKYHRGKRIGGGDKSWVFGGIQVTDVNNGEKKPYFSVVVEDRSRGSLGSTSRREASSFQIVGKPMNG